jgi:hypothetical protein
MKMSDTTQQRSTPIAAIAKGALAGIAGTLAMDLLWYARYRRGGGEDSFYDWEFSAGTTNYEQAAAPAQVGKRLVEGYLQTELPERTARAMNNAVHWATGTLWGAVHGVLAASNGHVPEAPLGLATGGVAWGSSYAMLAPAKLYKPIWEYPRSVLWKDLSAHLAYGLGTGAAFRALSR